MESFNVKTCDVCNTEKGVDDFYNKHRKCKQFSFKSFKKGPIIIMMIYYKNVEINIHVLENWIID